MHPIGLNSLNLRKEVRVEAELDQCPSFRRSCQFRFERLIRPWAEDTGLWNPDEKVRSAMPRAILKGRLVDHAGTTAKGIECLCCGFRPWNDCGNLGDFE